MTNTRPVGSAGLPESTPMAPADLQLLLALTRGPMHGYAMMKAVEAESGGTLQVELGSLYRILQRLERDGMVEESEVPADESPSPGRQRRYYRITSVGRTAVQGELNRLKSLIELAGDGRMRPGRAR